MVYLAYAAAWISTAAAVMAGMYFTHSPWCLWALLFPACISFPNHFKDDEDSEEEGEKKE